MTDDRKGVKPTTKMFNRYLDWIECHPRTGWYIAIVATLNLLLNFVDAFDFF